MSYPGSTSIILNTTGPVVNLNSPAGILSPDSSPDLELAQPQLLNSDYAQWVTYSGWSTADPTETVTFTAIGACLSTGSCTQIASGLGTTPFLWEWASPASNPSATWIQVTDQDQAGNSTSSALPPDDTTGVFSLFSPGSGACNLTCSPSGSNVPSCPGSPTVLCTTLADAVTDDYDIPGDPPSPSGTTCSGGLPIAFSGYADPSMRRDPLISTSNPYGTNLWMLYSWPEYQQVASPCSNTGVNEIHLAESDTSTGAPGGANWSAWCSGTGCTSATPIWPSETFATCAAFAGYSATCYSSHEVSNFWPYPNYPTSGSETWYAAHLMYYVKQGFPIGYTQIASGCLVMSVAGAPTSLGWSSGGPSPAGLRAVRLRSRPTPGPVTLPSIIQR